MFEKLAIVDGRGHLLGRLASIVAKELLNGQHVVVLRAEELNISGSREWTRHRAAAVPARVAPRPVRSPPPPPPPPRADYRNKLKWLEFTQKKHNTNPRRGGPFHYRAPSRVLWRAIRGML